LTHNPERSLNAAGQSIDTREHDLNGFTLDMATGGYAQMEVDQSRPVAAFTAAPG